MAGVSRVHVLVRHRPEPERELKPRPAWFDRRRIFDNLVATMAGDADASLLVSFDGTPEQAAAHFTHGRVEVRSAPAGSDGGSFLNVLDLATRPDVADDDIVYLLEDDYVHRPGWLAVLREAFDADLADYATLYDHPDKYTALYAGLQAQLVPTPSAHWRTTPSTTNTYACRARTLRRAPCYAGGCCRWPS